MDLKGITKIVNEDYAQGYILDSFMKAAGHLHEKVLLCYGDVMFDRTVIEPLIQRGEDIVLAVDPSFKKADTGHHTLELVRTAKRPSQGARSLENRHNPVLEISTKINKNKADYEFIGIALLSKKGFMELLKEYKLAVNKYKGKRFHGAAQFKKASFADMLNEMIKKKYRVETMAVRSGWIEMHTFENYKLACSLTA